jgi:hypothetical protein
MSSADVTEIIGELWIAARLLLRVLDALDERWPALKKVSNPLGRFLGGSKERY